MAQRILEGEGLTMVNVHEDDWEALGSDALRSKYLSMLLAPVLDPGEPAPAASLAPADEAGEALSSEQTALPTDLPQL